MQFGALADDADATSIGCLCCLAHQWQKLVRKNGVCKVVHRQMSVKAILGWLELVHAKSSIQDELQARNRACQKVQRNVK